MGNRNAIGTAPRVAAVVMLVVATLAVPVYAQGCSWILHRRISEPSHVMDSDSGNSGVAFWAWSYFLFASHLVVQGYMNFAADNCEVAIAKNHTGNGIYRVFPVSACPMPLEDIEGSCRNEFTAEAELDNDQSARALASLKIQATSIQSSKPSGGAMTAHSIGGVEATATAPGPGSSGTYTINLAHGAFPVWWNTEQALSQPFQDADSGSRGTSPETITCQTYIATNVAGGGLFDSDDGEARIVGPKAEVIVDATCDGDCRNVERVLAETVGY